MAKVAETPQSESIAVRMARQYRFEPEEFKRVVKKTCMPGNATEEEFLLFLAAANELELNPLTREIYAFARPQGGGIQHIIAADGWYKKANSHPANNGIQCHETFSTSGELVSCTATIHRKDRDYPTVVTEYLKENFRPTDNWRSRPVRMLRHRAISQGVRIAYGLGGVMDEEEYAKWVETTSKIKVAESPLDQVADDIPAKEPPKNKLKLVPPDFHPVTVEPELVKEEEPAPEPEYLDVSAQDMLERIIINNGWAGRDIPKVLEQLAGVNSLDKVQTSQLQELLTAIQAASAKKSKGVKESKQGDQ